MAHVFSVALKHKNAPAYYCKSPEYAFLFHEVLLHLDPHPYGKVVVKYGNPFSHLLPKSISILTFKKDLIAKQL